MVRLTCTPYPAFNVTLPCEPATPPEAELVSATCAGDGFDLTVTAVPDAPGSFAVSVPLDLQPLPAGRYAAYLRTECGCFTVEVDVQCPRLAVPGTHHATSGPYRPITECCDNPPGEPAP